MEERKRTAARNIPAPRSQWEETLALQFRLDSLAPPTREYKFDQQRRWRFDFAWPEYQFAVEVEGVTQDGGRHQRVDGFNKDLEKYEAAMLQGWTVYRVSQQMVKSGTAVLVIARMLEAGRRNTSKNTGIP